VPHCNRTIGSRARIHDDEPELCDTPLPLREPFLEFYGRLAEQQRGAVLELACGSGQLPVPLAAGGRSVGLDLAPAMLTAARRRTDEANLEVEPVRADVRDIDLDRRFGLLFTARTSLHTCTSPATSPGCSGRCGATSRRAV
jgi:SAM-dependent methyltransferase